MLKSDEVTITFKIDSDLSEKEKENIIYDVMNEIQDRFMYITEVKHNDKIFFKFDDNIYNK